MIARQGGRLLEGFAASGHSGRGRTHGRLVGPTGPLQWIVEVKPDNSRSFKVHRWTGSGYEEALRSDVAAR